MEGAILPSDWSGKLIGTQEVLNDIRLEVQRWNKLYKYLFTCVFIFLLIFFSFKLTQ